jgi:two-component system sensor histidine kinase MtrB
VTRTSLPEGVTGTPAPAPERAPAPDLSPRGSVNLRRVRRGLGRRTARWRRRLRIQTRRVAARALHAWRSSLQVRIAAITMVVAGTVVIIVSLVLFSQIRDQLLDVKRHAAIDQAQAGVAYAQTQVAGIATGDASSVRTALDGTVSQLRARSGAAGDFDVVMVRSNAPRPAAASSSRHCPTTCAPRSTPAARRRSTGWSPTARASRSRRC